MAFLPDTDACSSSCLHGPGGTQLTFDIIFRGEVIGELNAKRLGKENQTEYSSFTQTSVRLVRQMEVLREYTVVFQNGILQQAETLVTVNGRQRDHTTIRPEDGVYHICQDTGDAKLVRDQVNYANIQLLYIEPVGVSKVFSELEGEWYELVQEGGHSYHKINSKGRENCYYYENGQLKSAEIDSGLINFRIKLK